MLHGKEVDLEFLDIVIGPLLGGNGFFDVVIRNSESLFIVFFTFGIELDLLFDLRGMEEFGPKDGVMELITGLDDLL